MTAIVPTFESINIPFKLIFYWIVNSHHHSCLTLFFFFLSIHQKWDNLCYSYFLVYLPIPIKKGCITCHFGVFVFIAPSFRGITSSSPTLFFLNYLLCKGKIQLVLCQIMMCIFSHPLWFVLPVRRVWNPL